MVVYLTAWLVGYRRVAKLSSCVGLVLTTFVLDGGDFGRLSRIGSVLTIVLSGCEL